MKLGEKKNCFALILSTTNLTGIQGSVLRSQCTNALSSCMDSTLTEKLLADLTIVERW